VKLLHPRVPPQLRSRGPFMGPRASWWQPESHGSEF
jgi:hypothetical protein